MTHSPYAIIAERAIFLLSEMEDGAERIFFFTNRPNAAFLSQSPTCTAFRKPQQTAASQDPDVREDEYFHEVDHLCAVVEQFLD